MHCTTIIQKVIYVIKLRGDRWRQHLHLAVGASIHSVRIGMGYFVVRIASALFTVNVGNASSVEKLTSCAVQSVRSVLFAKQLKPFDIYRELCTVYGNDAMTAAGINHCYIIIKNDRTNVLRRS